MLMLYRICSGFDFKEKMGFYRTLQVDTHAEHLELERLYVCGQVYNTVLDIFYKLVVPPSLFKAGSAIVIAWYLTMRHIDMPWYIYSWFPYIGALFTVMTFALCYDGILVTRASEASLTTLRSTEMQYFLRLPIQERRAMIRRAKALRAAFFSVGNFTEFNIDVPISTWEEIVNQLFFLLTF